MTLIGSLVGLVAEHFSAELLVPLDDTDCMRPPTDAVDCQSTPLRRVVDLDCYAEATCAGLGKLGS